MTQSLLHLDANRKRDEKLWLCVAAAHGQPERVQREFGRTMSGRISKAIGGDVMSVGVWEAGINGDDVHFNEVVRGPAADLVIATSSGQLVPRALDAITRHASASKFDDLARGDVAFYVEPVGNIFGLNAYFASSEKPEIRLGARLGALGGERVKQSEALRRDLDRDGGIIAPRSYAARTIYKVDLFDGRLVDQTKPVSAVSAPRRRVRPTALPQLAFDVGPTVVDMMRDLARTHREMAAIVGVSRPHATNVLNGTFQPSRALSNAILAAHRRLGGSHLRLAA